MKSRLIIIAIVSLLLYGCGLRHKLHRIREIIGSIHQPTPEPEAEYYSVRNICPAYKNDTTIKEIKGLRVDINWFYQEYAIYRAPKATVLRAINAIPRTPLHPIYNDSICTEGSLQDLFYTVDSAEYRSDNAFFWHIRDLKDCQVYKLKRYPISHYIIFDRHSDTVYHRMSELSE